MFVPGGMGLTTFQPPTATHHAIKAHPIHRFSKRLRGAGCSSMSGSMTEL
jgi:hypothetical protein